MPGIELGDHGEAHRIYGAALAKGIALKGLSVVVNQQVHPLFLLDKINT